MSFFTFQDAIEHIIDYLGTNSADQQCIRDARRASMDALRDLVNAKTWSYLQTHGRITTSAPYSTGTVGYIHTGGTYERQLTIAGGTWPDWSAYGSVRVGDSTSQTDAAPVYEVDQRRSAAILSLSETLNPGADIDSGSLYTLYRDAYLLPADFIAQSEAMYQEYFTDMTFVQPDRWLSRSRYRYSPGPPREYTIVGDPKRSGRLMMRLYPSPIEAKTIDFFYHRRARELRLAEHSTGTVSASAASNTITGVNTGWSESMVGCVVRLSRTSSTAPTSVLGENPYDFESVITDFISSTSIQVADLPAATYSGVKYVISDPIEIEPGAMLTAYKRGMETQISMNRTLKDKPSARLQYGDALAFAKEWDSRSYAGRKAGFTYYRKPRLRDYPNSSE